MTKLWHAKETSCAIGPTVAAPATTSSMYAQVLAVGSTEVQLESVMRNVTISEPEGSVDVENFLGVTAATTGHLANFQNAEMSYKPFGIGSLTGTLVVTDIAKLEAFFMGTTGTAITTSESATRYQPGNFSSGLERQNSAIAVKLDQVGTLNNAGTAFVSICLNNCILTKVGDYKLSGSDGTWEVDFEAKCQPKDFYVEYMTA